MAAVAQMRTLKWSWGERKFSDEVIRKRLRDWNITKDMIDNVMAK